MRHYTNNNSIMAEIKSEETSEKKSLNFIEQIVENDLKEGKNDGKENYHVRVGNTLVKLAENDPRNKRIFRVGEQCHLTFAPDAVHVL